jgi:N-acetyl-anhydromuramyl-L-alanine amidase AmpD
MSRTNIVETYLDFNGGMATLSASEVAFLIVHHTGGAAGDDYSAAEIHQDHQINRRWAGIGYHYVIRKDGSIERGRPRQYRGAHCPDFNWRSLGVHLCGNFELEEPTPAQLESLALLLADLCEIYGLEAESIVGHRDCLATACPGEALYARLPEIRDNVAVLVAA